MNSSLRTLLAAVVALSAGFASGAERAPLKGVTAVRAANYGVPSKLVKDREEVGAIVQELNELRNKPWRQGAAKMKCYSTVILLAGEKQVALFQVRPDVIVERPVEKGESPYSLKPDDTDLLRLRKLLDEMPTSKQCEKPASAPQ